MPGRSSYFFGDANDLEGLIAEIVDIGDFQFVEIRSQLNQQNRVFTEFGPVLDLALVRPDIPVRRASFLVMPACDELVAREITLTDGSGIRRISDQNNNPSSAVLALGGDAGDRTLTMSDINTVGDTQVAIDIHNQLKKLVRSRSRNVGRKGQPVLVMPGAMVKLRDGWRLASGKDWSRSTDPEISPEALAQ